MINLLLLFLLRTLTNIVSKRHQKFSLIETQICIKRFSDRIDSYSGMFRRPNKEPELYLLGNEKPHNFWEWEVKYLSLHGESLQSQKITFSPFHAQHKVKGPAHSWISLNTCRRNISFIIKCLIIGTSMCQTLTALQAPHGLSKKQDERSVHIPFYR